MSRCLHCHLLRRDRSKRYCLMHPHNYPCSGPINNVSVSRKKPRVLWLRILIPTPPRSRHAQTMSTQSTNYCPACTLDNLHAAFQEVKCRVESVKAEQYEAYTILHVTTNSYLRGMRDGDLRRLVCDHCERGYCSHQRSRPLESSEPLGSNSI